MRAWLLDGIAGLHKLRLAETPEPTAQVGEAVVQVLYAALNPADRYLAEGLYPAKPAMPHILGRDGIGIITALGPGDSGGLAIGATALLLRGETGINRPGMFAQRCAVPVESLVKKPAGWSDQEAAGATLVYLTAYQALTQWGKLEPSVVLITGASGGVGVATTQLASAMGHCVIALSRSEPKRRQLQAIGANLALDPGDGQWKKQLKEFLAGRSHNRVDLAVDNIGGELFTQVLDTLGQWGKISVVGRLAGPVPQFNTATLFFRRVRIGGVAVGAYNNAESRAAWRTVTQLLKKKHAKPLVDSVFPFERLPDAFAKLQQGPMGKVLLAVEGR